MSGPSAGPTPTVPLADRMSRTDLLLGRRGLVDDFDGAPDWYARRPVSVVVAPDAAVTRAGQAAALTAVTLLRRAGLPVTVSLDADAAVLAGPSRDESLGAALETSGAAVAVGLGPGGRRDAASDGYAARVLVGGPDGPAAAGVGPSRGPSVQATWDGWVAAVRMPGDRLPERDGCVLAAILSASLCVSELFHHLTGSLEAAWRPVTMSLWEPLSRDPAAAVGPRLTSLPDSWAVVGLGHLGQAHAWCLAYLDYEPGLGEVWLVDDDVAAEANISTGVLTHASDLTAGPGGRPRRKTRLVGDALEAAGRPTRIFDRRLATGSDVGADMPSVALVGVDNLALRRSLSDMGWRLCVDAGLGSTSSSYASFSLHVFDGSARSADVAAWQEGPPRPPDLTARAFRSLEAGGVDQCGLVTLAGKNVAVAFVGMTAACLSVGEALRRVCEGVGTEALGVSLESHSVRGNATAARGWRGPCVAAARH